MKAALLYRNSEIYVEGYSRRYPELPLVEEPLVITDIMEPSLGDHDVLLKIEACGVCYTDIDIIEGRVRCKIPVIPGHQVVGRVIDKGDQAPSELIGTRVGVAWIYGSCGNCFYCRRGLENLCVDFKATGCHANGGYAEFMAVNPEYTYILPSSVDPVKLAPLMCAGAVGYRALKLLEVKSGEVLGLFGFGASAHIVIQVARLLYPDVEVYVFTRSLEHQDHAWRLGASWVGHPYETPPRLLDKAIDFTPVGEIIPRILELVRPGGRLVVNVIRKQTPVNLEYEKHLWMEREIKSVANVTRKDVKELLELTSRRPVDLNTVEYSLGDVNKALRDVKSARIKGSAVLRIV
ncbi:MAG: zinc-binding alcohol dehydrogenase family protein [Ignisphaera sp.]